MYRIILYLSLVWLLIPSSLLAQGEATTICNAEIATLLQKHKELNTINPTTAGFRIQIFWDSGNASKEGAFDQQAIFSLLFPEMTSYISFDEPYYRVKVGDFRTRLDAELFLEKLQKEVKLANREELFDDPVDFDGAFIVPTQIRFPAL